jgi:hypothetical protein
MKLSRKPPEQRVHFTKALLCILARWESLLCNSLHHISLQLVGNVNFQKAHHVGFGNTYERQSYPERRLGFCRIGCCDPVFVQDAINTIYVEMIGVVVSIHSNSLGQLLGSTSVTSLSLQLLYSLHVI